MINLALFLVGYLLLGSFNTSIILSRRVKNDDIREHNSKNAGATNSLRTYGTKFALAVFADWCTKNTYSYFNNCFAIVNHIQAVKEFSLISYISPQAIGLGVVLGHIFPIYYKFKGGKGAACTVGLIISINIILFLIAFIIFLLIVGITKIVSLGSITVAFSLLLFVWMPWMVQGPVGYWPNAVEYANRFIPLSNYWFVSPIIYTLCALLVVVSHRDNFKRLINKTERKFSVKKVA
nr:glycerol-3-phosphate 1-O-acyltransferase PlsY [Mycoplasmopsis bovis]